MTTSSTADGPRGLMAFWAEIDPAYLLRYQEWHNCEHVPERVAIPGFLTGRRYRDVSGTPRFLMFYETTEAAILASEPYFAALNNPTPWTREALKSFRDPARNIYELVATRGAPDVNPAPYLATMRFNLDPAREQELLALHTGALLDSLAARDDVVRARIYRVDEAITGIVTSERKIYGGGPGAQRYLAMVETTAPLPHAVLDAVGGAEDGRSDVFADSFFIEFGYVAGRD